jgi:hypothetical protein
VIIMAVVETYNIDGAIVRINDQYIRSREESEKAMERAADIIFRQLNAQHRAKKLKEETTD